MSALTPVNQIIDGEDFTVQVANRPHLNLVTRDEELLALISSTSGNVQSGYYSRLYVDWNNSSSVKMLSGMKAVDDTGVAIMELTGNKTITITSNGANGLDTGSPSTGWYHLYLIRALGEGTEAGLISASGTSPTMPDGYVYKRRVGALRYSGGILRYNQRNEDHFYLSRYTVYSGTNPGSSFSNLDLSSYLPDGYAYLAHLSMRLSDTDGDNGRMYVAIGNAADGSTNGHYFIGGEVSDSDEHLASQGICIVDQNGRISIKDNGDVNRVYIYVNGFRIDLG